MKASQSRYPHDSLFATLRPLIKLDVRHLVVLVALVLSVIDLTDKSRPNNIHGRDITGMADSRHQQPRGRVLARSVEYLPGRHRGRHGWPSLCCQAEMKRSLQKDGTAAN